MTIGSRDWGKIEYLAVAFIVKNDLKGTFLSRTARQPPRKLQIRRNLRGIVITIASQVASRGGDTTMDGRGVEEASGCWCLIPWRPTPVCFVPYS